MPPKYKYVPREPSFPSQRYDYEERHRYLNLSRMDAVEKQKTFAHLKKNKPEVVAFLQDPFVQALREMFDGEICLLKEDIGEVQ